MENSRRYGKNTIIHCFGGLTRNKYGRRQMQSKFLSVILKRKYFIYTLSPAKKRSYNKPLSDEVQTERRKNPGLHW